MIMKKLISILVLGLLLSGNAIAKCITFDSCPKHPQFSQNSIRANLHDHGWLAKKVFKDLKKKYYLKKRQKNKKKYIINFLI